MIELDAGQSTDSYVSDGSDATFMQDVVEASKTTPVIVDFWAPWCGPCKTLGPALEKAVAAQKGAVRMVKIDVDQNQMIAGQLQVQSIPTVYAFWEGQPVDGFQGALPGSEVDAFVAKIAAMGGGADEGLDAAIEAAEAMLAEGAVADAAETFAAIIQEDPNCAAAFAGLARAHLALDQLDEAEAVLNGAPAEVATDGAIEAVRAQIELTREAAHAGPAAELEAQLSAAPDDPQIRFDLANALQAQGDSQGAVDQLLELFRRDRDWNNGAAKDQLFKLFEALGPTDPVVQAGRRKLSSMIFA